jgi:hypothetical protein
VGGRLDGWRRLNWHERGIFALCTVGLAGTHLSLALFGYKSTRQMVEIITRRARQHPASRDDINAACRLAQLAAIAGRHGAVAATCLRQSLLVYGWLRWRGLDPKLLLGIMPENGSFQAHAWVELEGTLLLKRDRGYAPIQPKF